MLCRDLVFLLFFVGTNLLLCSYFYLRKKEKNGVNWSVTCLPFAIYVKGLVFLESKTTAKCENVRQNEKIQYFLLLTKKKNTASVCWKKDSMFYFINMLNSVIYCSVYFHIILLLILCWVRSVKFIWPTQLKLSHFDKNSKYNGTQSNFLQISFFKYLSSCYFL